MDLYVIRHAEALPLGAGIADDADRPLTTLGQAQCGSLAEALKRQKATLEHVITSPLLRARQTAEGLLKELGSPKPDLQTCDDLAPGGKRKKLTRFLRAVAAQSVAIVGHEPDLSQYVAWLIGSRKARIDLSKSGIACVTFEVEPRKGLGVLTWLVTPQWYG